MSEKSHPVGGVDYPRTMQEFDEWFPNEVACVEYLRRLRWPEGFQCPNCGKKKAWLTGRGLLRCASCQRQTSVIAGTLFEGTRKPLRTWFQAMWYITGQTGVFGNSLSFKVFKADNVMDNGDENTRISIRARGTKTLTEIIA